MVTYNKLIRLSPPSWKHIARESSQAWGCLAVTLLALRWHVSRLTWNPPRGKLLTPADTSPLTRFVGPTLPPHLLTCIPQLFRLLLISTVECYYVESSNYYAVVISFHHRFLFLTDRVTQWTPEYWDQIRQLYYLLQTYYTLPTPAGVGHR